MKPSSILLFEPSAPETLFPFSVLHPSWELRVGALRLFEKVQREFPSARLVFYADASREYHLRSFLARFGGMLAAAQIHPARQAINPDDVRVDDGRSAQDERIGDELARAISYEDVFRVHTEDIRVEDMLVLQANVLPSAALWRTMRRDVEAMRETAIARPLVFTQRGEPIAAWVPRAVLAAGSSERYLPDAHQLSSLRGAWYDTAQEVSVDARIITHLWDALKWNGEAINDDARFFELSETLAEDSEPLGGEWSVWRGIYVMNADHISLGRNVKIAPSVVLDASAGAVIVDDEVQIMPQATLVGPCYIGKSSVVKIGTKLYEHTSIGEYSKIGGEVKNTIIQAYTNKQHDGCVGYSFLSEWVNLGAGTNVSDLKNNYSRIRVRLPARLPGASRHEYYELQTGQTSLGLLCGDHSKSGINTMFNTGTVVGVSANVFDGNYPEKFIPSFSWGGRSDSPLFETEKAIALARTVMQRRKRTLTVYEEALLRAEANRYK
jgi:UDP-N-acetylglucosamine diphosphorylase/glucosamine-1-phosphate N-acetyltransferase